MPKFNLKDYTQVNDRMKLARDTWQSIVVSPPIMLTPTVGYVQATITLRDGRVATENAQFRLDLTGQGAQATFPIEDASTSAVGRALGRFGFGTDDHFPSREEMELVERVAHAGFPPLQPAEPEPDPVAQAEQRFWQDFGDRFGTQWEEVEHLFEESIEYPTTIEGWRAAYRRVKAALAARGE